MHGVAGEFEAPLFGAYSKKVGMWLFLASDSLTFGALLFAFSYNRIYTVWPTPFGKESIINATVMTACLLSSSLTMVMAVFAAQRHDRAWTRNWLLATMAFGTAFIVLHGMEWTHLIHEGLTLPGFPKPAGQAEGRVREDFIGRAAVCRDIFWADGDAHAARDDWRDLSGRGGAAEMVSADSGSVVAGGIFSDSGGQCFSLWDSCAADRADCCERSFFF